LFCSFGYVNCIGLFEAQYQRDQLREYSHSTVAWITSLEVGIMYFSMAGNGIVYDRWGPVPLLVGGTFLHVFGLMMASLSTKYYQILLSQSICSALGASALFTAATSPVGSWFLKRRALAFGIVASGSSLGGVILPVIVTRMLPNAGFPWAMRTCAFLFLVLLIPACFTVRARTPPAPRGFALGPLYRPFLYETAFRLNALGLLFFSWGMFVPFNFLPLEAEHRGMRPELANYMISVLNAASIFGRIVPGYLGDRIGRFNVMVVTTLMSAVFVLALWLPSPQGSNAATVAFAIVFGVSSGTFVGMTPALVQTLSPVDEIGARMGATFALMSGAVLTGNPIAGALVQRDGGGYAYLKVFCGCAMAVGSGLLFAARIKLGGWGWKRV
jgi:MFS family permease